MGVVAAVGLAAIVVRRSWSRARTSSRAVVVAVIVCAIHVRGPVGALVGAYQSRTSGVETAPAKSIENEPGRDDPDASFCLKEIPVSDRRPRV